jgi:6-phosphogluconate dehydrogenase (decarboxylating)
MMDAYQTAREALSEFRQQDDYLLAHGASLMSEDSHEILHTDTLRRAVAAATAQQAAEADSLRAEIERLRARGDAEAIILACVPGGSICDPQEVADAIREFLPPNDQVEARPCR